MQEAEPDAAEETIAYALGRTKAGIINDLRGGSYEKKGAARRLVARRIIEHLKLCGYAIMRVRPPIDPHTTGPVRLSSKQSGDNPEAKG